MEVLVISAYRVCQEHKNAAGHTKKQILANLDQFITSWQNNHGGGGEVILTTDANDDIVSDKNSRYLSQVAPFMMLWGNIDRTSNSNPHMWMVQKESIIYLAANIF